MLKELLMKNYQNQKIMELALPPMMGSSGFLPSGSLLECLIHVSNEVASMEKLPFVQVRNISTTIRRVVKLLSSLFEEIQEINTPLPPSSVLCLTELLSVIKRVKVLIEGCKDGAIDNIVEVLQSGKTMEARENAAAAIFSLSMIDDFKVAIGAHPRAILALVGLLREGTTAGKRDTATAIFNLALYNANKASIIVAGAVPLLIELLMDDKAGITDDALGVLALLLRCPEGLEAIKKSRALVPLLIDLLRFGSAKGKENSIKLLLGLCKDGGDEVVRRLLINPRSIPSLRSLAADGSLKARRKADALLEIHEKIELLSKFDELIFLKQQLPQ